MKETQLNFSLEWEYKAFEEVKEWFKKRYKENKNHFDKLSEENIRVVNKLHNEGVRFYEWQPDSSNEIAELQCRIFKEIIYCDPLLYRVLLNTMTFPDDLNTRKLLEGYLPTKEVSPLKDYIKYSSLLEDSELAKSKTVDGEPIKSINTFSFVVGEILYFLFWEYEYFKLIDLVKKTGVEKSVAELREKRTYRVKEGIVLDFSPLLKKTITTNGVKSEIFSSETVASKVIKEISQKMDDTLCSFIKETSDSRINLFYGSRENKSNFTHTIHHGTEACPVPFQLLPKWINKVKKEAGNKTLTEIEMTGDEIVNYKKEEEMQEGMLGLIRGAKTWDKSKGPATNWLSQNVKWQLGKAFEEQSTTSIKDERGSEKPKRKEELESGGRLDSLIDKNDPSKGIFKDILDDPKENTEEDFIKDYDVNKAITKLCKNNPEIKEILEKEKRGEALNDRERQMKSRVIKKERSRLNKS